MSHQEIRDLVNTAILIVFVAGVTIEVIQLGFRIRQYRKAQWPVPLLVWRELVFFTGLAFPFLAILVVRAADVGANLREEIWWALLTGIPAIIGIWFWLWIEFFKIGEEGPISPPKE